MAASESLHSCPFDEIRPLQFQILQFLLDQLEQI